MKTQTLIIEQLGFYMEAMQDINHDISMLLLSSIHIPEENKGDHYETGLKSIQKKYIDWVYAQSMSYKFTTPEEVERTKDLQKKINELSRYSRRQCRGFKIKK